MVKAPTLSSTRSLSARAHPHIQHNDMDAIIEGATNTISCSNTNGSNDMCNSNSNAAMDCCNTTTPTTPTTTVYTPPAAANPPPASNGVLHRDIQTQTSLSFDDNDEYDGNYVANGSNDKQNQMSDSTEAESDDLEANECNGNSSGTDSGKQFDYCDDDSKCRDGDCVYGDADEVEEDDDEANYSTEMESCKTPNQLSRQNSHDSGAKTDCEDMADKTAAAEEIACDRIENGDDFARNTDTGTGTVDSSVEEHQLPNANIITTIVAATNGKHIAPLSPKATYYTTEMTEYILGSSDSTKMLMPIQEEETCDAGDVVAYENSINQPVETDTQIAEIKDGTVQQNLCRTVDTYMGGDYETNTNCDQLMNYANDSSDRTYDSHISTSNTINCSSTNANAGSKTIVYATSTAMAKHGGVHGEKMNDTIGIIQHLQPLTAIQTIQQSASGPTAIPTIVTPATLLPAIVNHQTGAIIGHVAHGAQIVMGIAATSLQPTGAATLQASQQAQQATSIPTSLSQGTHLAVCPQSVVQQQAGGQTVLTVQASSSHSQTILQQMSPPTTVQVLPAITSQNSPSHAHHSHTMQLHGHHPQHVHQLHQQQPQHQQQSQQPQHTTHHTIHCQLSGGSLANAVAVSQQQQQQQQQQSPPTHIFPVHVISLPSGAHHHPHATHGSATAWPAIVEAPIYIDANGEPRTFCPAHPPQGALVSSVQATQSTPTVASVLNGSQSQAALQATQQQSNALQSAVLSVATNLVNGNTITLSAAPTSQQQQQQQQQQSQQQSQQREHRVLLQLDAGVSLPVQIGGKRKIFRGQ